MREPVQPFGVAAQNLVLQVSDRVRYRVGPELSLSLDVVGAVLQIAGRAHGGNFFHRAGLAAQLLAQACNGRRVE